MDLLLREHGLLSKGELHAFDHSVNHSQQTFFGLEEIEIIFILLPSYFIGALIHSVKNCAIKQSKNCVIETVHFSYFSWMAWLQVERGERFKCLKLKPIYLYIYLYNII